MSCALVDATAGFIVVPRIGADGGADLVSFMASMLSLISRIHFLRTGALFVARTWTSEEDFLLFKVKKNSYGYTGTKELMSEPT
jgi:hypothetical protein